MKENVTEIMNDLKIGQVVIFQGEEYVFVEPKRTRGVFLKRGFDKKYSIKGTIEITEEIDQEVVDRLEQEAIDDLLLERKVKNMKVGQCFIGTNDKEYCYMKFNRTNFTCKDLQSGIEYKAKPAFIKNILDKIIEQK